MELTTFDPFTQVRKTMEGFTSATDIALLDSGSCHQRARRYLPPAPASARTPFGREVIHILEDLLCVGFFLFKPRAEGSRGKF